MQSHGNKTRVAQTLTVFLCQHQEVLIISNIVWSGEGSRGGVRKEFGYKIVACLFEAGKKNSLPEGMTGNHITILEAGFTHPKPPSSW